MNSDALLSLLPYLAVFVALGLGGVAYWKDHQRRDQAWKDFAALHGWDITASWNEWSVDGLHRRRRFQLRTEYRRVGKNRSLYTMVYLDLGEAIPIGTRIRPEGLGRKLLKVIGKGDEEIGDAEFDNAFELTHLSDEVRAVLRTPDVRRQLLLLRQRFGTFVIDNEQLQAQLRGMPNSVEALESLVTPALQLSDALDRVVEARRERQHG
ncbi:hypothetical protein A176_006020 [Myxococcus hansupus]|uniref:DUF3137 domain-containing protein n=1 Tax=Pseudomyxococcus hansupus TaxID=1297742 RepID=A0A0H4X5H2_9BACT|nr:hypothetical protein [Myxococcus hansupus]AKQ69108.1 hypothetical protein A176_006020 [Myxococcus hansupus]